MNPLTPKMVCSDSPSEIAVSPSSLDENSCVGVGVVYATDCFSLDEPRLLVVTSNFLGTLTVVVCELIVKAKPGGKIDAAAIRKMERTDFMMLFQRKLLISSEESTSSGVMRGLEYNV